MYISFAAVSRRVLPFCSVAARLSTSEAKLTPSRLIQTSVFVQSGQRISELPLVVVKKVGGATVQKAPKKEESGLSSSETLELIAGLRRCCEVGSVLRLLETIPAEEVTPEVALEAMKVIAKVDADAMEERERFRKRLLGPDGCSSSSHETPFLRHAFVSTLLDIVYRSRKPRTLIDGLRMVSGWGGSDNDDDSILEDFKEKAFEEILVMVAEGKLTAGEVFDAVSAVGGLYAGDRRRCHESADKLWNGLVDKVPELDETTLAAAFRSLAHLKRSRATVLKALEEKTAELWTKLRKRDALEIVAVLADVRMSSGGGSTIRQIASIMSQWAARNLHALSEEELLALVRCYTRLEHADGAIVSALERYVKARGVLIEDADLVAAACDYCLSRRVRSRVVLEGAGEYLVSKGSSLTPAQLGSISRVFCELDFHPPNGFRFWEVLERAMDERFAEFPPSDVVGLMLSFVYVERHPLNFVRKLFHPRFVDRLPPESLPALKLFDAAMRVECPKQYGGPFLPPKEGGHRPVGVVRLTNTILGPLGAVVGDVRRIATRVPLSSLPLDPLYVADAMVYPSVPASRLRFGLNTDNSRLVAVIVHLPEHYDSSGRHLVGSQAMRVRHFRKMGFKVMRLRHSHVARLLRSPGRLREVLQAAYGEALAG